MSDRPKLSPGDRVQYSFVGKTGDTGTVLKVTPKKLKTGGSSAHVQVQWDSNGHVGRQEERALKLLPEGEDPKFLQAAANMRAFIAKTEPVQAAACPRCGGWTSMGGMSQHAKSKVPVMGRKGCSC